MPQLPIQPLSNVTVVSPDDTLAKAFARLDSSHDCAFVMDDDRFVGIVTPGYTLFHKHLPITTKVENALQHPTRLTIDSDPATVAAAMLQMDATTLPVFDERGILAGGITARDLIKLVHTENPEMFHGEHSLPPIPVVSESTSIGLIYNAMREKKQSRQAVVDENGHLIGLITRKDIHTLLSRKTGNTRFSPHGNDARGGENDPVFDEPVAKYMITNVVTADHQTRFISLVHQLLETNAGSIILVNEENAPQGILSLRYLIELVSRKPAAESVSVHLTRVREAVGETTANGIETLVRELAEKLNKRDALERIEVSLDLQKNSAGVVTEYQVVVHLKRFSGKHLEASAEDRDIILAIRDAFKKLEGQAEHQREEH